MPRMGENATGYPQTDSMVENLPVRLPHTFKSDTFTTLELTKSRG